MKKLILALLIVAMLGGVGYLVYLIYNSQSIKTVELIGTPQTIYLTGDSIDYEGAYIKVTHKNGDVKEIPLDSSSVQISMFSTSDVKAGGYSHGTMNIVYKDNTFKVEYDVLQRGFYYVSSETYLTAGASATATTGTYTTADTPTAIYFDEAGKLLYYTKDWTNGYTLYDGNYTDDYGYEIVGNEIKIKAGSEEFSIKAIYDAALRQTVYKSEKFVTDANGLQSGKTMRTFNYYQEGAIVLNNDYAVNIDFTKESRRNSSTSSTNPTLIVSVSGDGFDSGDYKIFLHLNFISNNNFLVNVYVKIYNSMFDDGGINIEGGEGVFSTSTHVNYKCFGKNLIRELFYTLV